MDAHGYKSEMWFFCEKTARQVFMQVKAVVHAKNNTSKNSRVGLCNLPSGFLFLTFCEMATFA
jgi:hypothetical protein